MEWQLTFLIIIGGLLLVLMAGVPVFAAFFLIDMLGVILFMGGIDVLPSLIGSILGSIGNFTLTPVILFIIMGEAIFLSGMANRAIKVVEQALKNLPGRLSLVAIGGGAVFDCLSGSALGTCAMFGSLLLPEMTKRKYSKYMSMGPIMAGSALAVVIPPSTLAIVLAAQAGISVGKLLIAGLVPGFMLAGLFALFIIITALINPSMTPKAQEREADSSHLFLDFLKYLLPLGLIVLSVLGSIVSGLATPTEASALGALTSFILAAVYRRLDMNLILKSAKNCLELSTMIFAIVAGSVAFSQLLAFTGVTRGMVEFASGLALPPKMIIGIILIFLLLMGTMIEQVSMIMICVPIFMPIATALGFDSIWFGLLMLLSITTGLITPPFGLLLFIMKGVSKETKITDVYSASMPYISIILLGLALILVFPGIATWLPGVM